MGERLIWLCQRCPEAFTNWIPQDIFLGLISSWTRLLLLESGRIVMDSTALTFGSWIRCSPLGPAFLSCLLLNHVAWSQLLFVGASTMPNNHSMRVYESFGVHFFACMECTFLDTEACTEVQPRA
ncbi:hypothetical protein KC359_g241 [Hortaea werneckii]|nr:hypothetical protein KC359_g241 [Hortaea werneckii]